MASQITADAVTTPVTIDDDTIIVGVAGSISSNGLGTALTLTGAYTGVINGGLYAINDTAAHADSQYNLTHTAGHEGGAAALSDDGAPSHQLACKPGSVSRRCRRATTIHLRRPLPDA